MTKTKGAFVLIKAFLPIDKTDFDKQADAYKMLAEIRRTSTLPVGFWNTAVIADLSAREGSFEMPVVEGDGPADTPLTDTPLPDGDIVIEATTGLDMHIFQTIKRPDGTEYFRRISADQDEAERKTDKKRPKPKPAA